MKALILLTLFITSSAFALTRQDVEDMDRAKRDGIDYFEARERRYQEDMNEADGLTRDGQGVKKCRSDADCGLGTSCVKGRSSHFGACLRD